MKGDLKTRVKNKFKTYEKCADIIGIDANRFRGLINGKTKWERVEIIKICTALGMTKSEMLEYFEPTDIVFVKYFAVREKILEKYESIGEYASAIGCSSHNINKKLNGVRPWTSCDIEVFCNTFDIPHIDAEFYFGELPNTNNLRYHIKKRYDTVENLSNALGCSVTQLLSAFNRKKVIPEHYVDFICDACNIDSKTYFECVPVIKNAFEVLLGIKDGERKELAEKLGMSYNVFINRTLGYKKWTDNEIQALKDLLNTGNICDFIDSNGFTKMITINKYIAKKGVW